VIDKLPNIYVPIVLGTGAIVAWISLRNESISGRIRDLKKEEWGKDTKKERRECIKKQIIILHKDYKRNRFALGIGVASIFIFLLLMVVSVLFEGGNAETLIVSMLGPWS
jgi:hypothetical protein